MQCALPYSESVLLQLQGRILIAAHTVLYNFVSTSENLPSVLKRRAGQVLALDQVVAFATDLETINTVFGTERRTDANVAAANSPISILRSYTVAFLDTHLKGETASLLDGRTEPLAGAAVEITTK